MSTVVIGGGGPRPNARIVAVMEVGETTPTYEIRDGYEILAERLRLSYAQALLPLIQSGE